MPKIKALVFDVGSSAFNWKDAIAPLIAQEADKYSASITVEDFADKWRIGMQTAYVTPKKYSKPEALERI